MVKKRGLGKSLDALLAYTGTDNQQSSTASDEPIAKEKLAQISVDTIHRGKYQPRREMDREALEELAHSIRAQGIIQPLLLRPIADGYEIIAGERRWRAAQLAGLTEVPAIIREIPDEAAIAMALIENIQRENLNPIEEAIALQRLIDEFEMTHQKVAEAVGKSRASVTNLLRLLALVPDVRNMLERGMLEMGHARCLLTLNQAEQLEAAQQIVTRGLSVRETENLVRRLQEAKSNQHAKSKRSPDPDIVRLQDKLSRQLKMKVAISCNAKGRGKVVVHYRNLNELDKLLAHLEETEEL